MKNSKKDQISKVTEKLVSAKLEKDTEIMMKKKEGRMSGLEKQRETEKGTCERE